MNVAWDAITPWSSLAGGALIGLSAALLILGSGRVAGISGILGGLLKPHGPDTLWRVAFLLGLLAAPIVWRLFAALPEAQPVAGTGLLLVAGWLVGIGTRYGSGCTSGHGVCGLSRLSPRSLLATLVFMGAGFATVFIVRHLSGA